MVYIQQATSNDIYDCALIIKSAAQRINKTGSGQWEFILKQDNVSYLNSKLAENQLYIFKDSSKTIGMCLLLTQPEEWDIDLWRITSFNGYFLHRFALADEYVGKGYAKQCLKSLQNFARNNQKNLKLDCLKHQQYLNNMYQSADFKLVGHGEHLTLDNYLFEYNLYEWNY